MLQVKNLTVRQGTQTILKSLNFTVEKGQWLMVVGPNGAGKSTLTRALSQGVPYSGEIMFLNENMANFKPAERAKKIGVLAQTHEVGYSFSVEEVVRLGRYAYSNGPFRGPNPEDDAQVRLAFQKTGLTELSSRSILTLSGGELQRTFLAQLFAQNPTLLILDEPTNHLDLVYQKQIFDLLREWISTSGGAVLSVVHDLSLAKAYGTHTLLLNSGMQIAFGQVNEVLTPKNLESVYSINVYGWMKDMFSQWEL